MASAVSASFKRIGAALFFCGAILFLVQVAGHNSTDHISTKPSLPSTLPKVELAEPTLSDAKEAIPSALKTIYESLNQGNPAQAAQNLSPQILQRAALLDLICRPFTYRAHYVEAIIARPFPANGRAAPGQQFQVRVRSLFTPLEERAQTMMFRITQGRCVLEEVSETGDDWFGPQKEEAKEIVRRFIYAAKAGRQDVLAETVSPNLGFSKPATEEDEQLQKHLSWIREVQIARASITQYRGLKISIGIEVPEPLNWTSTKGFDLERINGSLRIVRAFYTMGANAWKGPNVYEDPDIETYTLKRFGLTIPDAPAVAEEDDIYHVGGDVTSPELVSKVEPQVPGLSGVVVASIVIDTDGSVLDATILKGLGPDPDEKVIEAVRKWKFRPGMKSGEPVKTRASVTVVFGR